MWLTRISINNPYFAAVMMLMLLLLGCVAFNRISIEEFPDVKFPVAVVTTNYKGASPEVVEADISKPLEQEINTINGLKTLRSYSYEGISYVVAEFTLDTDPEIAVQDVRDKVTVVASNFKKEIDAPVVSKVDQRDQAIMSIAFY